MAAVGILLELLNSNFGYMILGGIIVYMISTYCRNAKTAARAEFAALCVCTAGSVSIVAQFAARFHHG